MDLFEKYDEKIELNKSSDEYELIIENTFNYYILINYYIESQFYKNKQQFSSEEDEELNEFFEQMKNSSENKFIGIKILGNFSNLVNFYLFLIIIL